MWIVGVAVDRKCLVCRTHVSRTEIRYGRNADVAWNDIGGMGTEGMDDSEQVRVVWLQFVDCRWVPGENLLRPAIVARPSMNQ